MKKIMFAVMAMCAIGFTACGNKTQAPADNTEAVEAMVYNAEEEAAASINQLTEQIEAQDAAEGAVDAAKDAVQNAAEDAKDAAKQKAGEAVDAAADQAKKALGI